MVVRVVIVIIIEVVIVKVIVVVIIIIVQEIKKAVNPGQEYKILSKSCQNPVKNNEHVKQVL